MSGGLLQLVAYGSQDVYLSGNPSISFFKSIYRRYTSFALEAIQCTFSGSVGFGKRTTVTVPRNGDLLHTIYVEVTMKKHASNESHFPAEQLLKEVELEIGGQRIDKLYSDWLRVHSELYHSSDEKAAYRRMVDFEDPSAGGDAGVVKRFYVPLTFFFCKSPSLALPLVALQYHEVRLNITFESATNMAANGIDTSVEPTADLYATFIYLDSSERKRFSQSSHEYLVTVTQFTGAETISPGASTRTTNIRLNMNHPVKQLAWVLKGSNHGSFTVGPRGTDNDRWAALSSAKLQLNGHDRFDERKGSYFNTAQPYEHMKTKQVAGVYSYSFALRPSEVVQPSGSCNFSRIDNATLSLTTKSGSVSTDGDALANVLSEDTAVANIEGNLTNCLIFAESYNVLRVLSGMGGLAYSS